MKKFIKISAVVLAAIVLSACGTTSTIVEPQIIYRTKIQVAVVPDHILSNCEVPSPPNRDVYVLMNQKQREDALAEYSTKLLESVSRCNNAIDEARTWGRKQRELYLKEQNKVK